MSLDGELVPPPSNNVVVKPVPKSRFGERTWCIEYRMDNDTLLTTYGTQLRVHDLYVEWANSHAPHLTVRQENLFGPGVAAYIINASEDMADELIVEHRGKLVVVEFWWRGNHLKTWGVSESAFEDAVLRQFKRRSPTGRVHIETMAGGFTRYAHC